MVERHRRIAVRLRDDGGGLDNPSWEPSSSIERHEGRQEGGGEGGE